MRGVAGDTWADIVIGKPNFETITPYNTVSTRLYLPHGVFIDRTNPSDNKMYVYDAGNSRILGFDVEDCRASESNPWDCEPEIVIGQVDFTTSTCNGDSAFQNYPVLPSPDPSMLCGLDPPQLSISEGGSGASMAVDSEGSLYVTDFFNHRVLKYEDPFGTDQVADEVWGQVDFTQGACNKGMEDPDATSLCFSWGDSNNWTAGVDIDPDGNLWIVDSGNNRVLRFSESDGTIAKTADLVLGQEDFTSSGSGSGLNQLYDPNAVRVTSNGVYVSERFNSRVMFYDGGSLATGMNGEVFGEDFTNPSGVDLDPTEPGRIWIANTGNSILELWDETSETRIRSVGFFDNGNVLGDVTGSIGVDSAGNLYAATGLGDYNNDVLIFDKDNPDQEFPTHLLFTPSGDGNFITQGYMGSSNGVVLTDDQFISPDAGRILFWDTPNGLSDLSTGDLPDGFVGAPDFNTYGGGCCMGIKTDESGHLYTAFTTNGDDLFSINIYELPLTNGESPVKIIRLPLDALGGGEIEFDHPFQGFTGILPAPDGSYLWASLGPQNRTIRIRNPLSENPVVDVILGQTTLSGNECNQGAGQGSPTSSTLCNPGEMGFDQLGNLWLSDSWLEIFGNYRLLRYDASNFPVDNPTLIYATAANQIINNIATWEPAFDLLNRMAIGFNPYYGFNPEIFPGGGYFPALYESPLEEDAVPSEFLSDYYSMAYGSWWDADNNLYMTDHNRGRIMIYFTPLDNPAPVLTEVTPVSTPTFDTSPDYTFNTDRAGTITYGGACSSMTTEAVFGDNTITFVPMSPGTYSDCTIMVTDNNDQDSNILTVNTFTIEAPPPTPTPTPSPTPPPTNPPSPGGSSSGSSSGSSPSAPVCSAWVPVGYPDLFQINRTNTGSATLYFTPVNDYVANYHVVYGFTNGDQQFGLLSAPVTPTTNNGVQSITINDLSPRTTYWFSVAPVNGCAVGNWSNWMEAKGSGNRNSIFYRYLPASVQNLLGL